MFDKTNHYKGNVIMVSVLQAGNEVQVNTTTALDQYEPSITTLSNGDYVVVWTSQGQDGSQSGIFAQVYDPAGVPIGGETQVNTNTLNQQARPSVTALPDGGFAVAWQSSAVDISSWDIALQRYDANYDPDGTEIAVTSDPFRSESDASLVALPDGRFVVTWTRQGTGNSYEIYAQRYEADGTPEGGQTLINSYSTGEQRLPDITVLADGSYVIVWQSDPQDEPPIGGVGGSSGIYMQRYDIDGNPLGGETLVNTTVAGDQYEPDVVALAGGGYVVTWYDTSNRVYMQAFDNNGAAAGTETLVSNSGLGQYGLVMAPLSGGGYVVVFAVIDSNNIGLAAQRYDAAGIPVGSPLPVNTTFAGAQYRPSVTGTADDGFIITWQSDSGDGSGTVVHSRTYTTSGELAPGIDFAEGTINADVFSVAANGLNAGDIVRGLAGHDVLDFLGGGVNTAVGATLDSIEEIQLTNATGTTLTVNNVAQALLVTTATGAADALVVNSGSLTVAQRQTLYSAGVESLTDQQGTYTHSQVLNAGIELSDGTNAADTFTVNAGGLNAGDKVYGADGHDILNFTGGGVNTAVGAALDSIEEIQLTNATGTTLTVNNVAQALLVTTATGAADALTVTSGTFTVAQRRALFDLGVESLSDAQGTYLSTNAAPATVADIAVGNEDGTLISNVVQNDSDANGDTLTVVPGSIVVTGFTPSAGLVLPANGGPVIDIASLQSHFVTSGANIVFNPGVNGHSFQFLDSGQSITVTMTYNVTDGVSNVTQSTLTFTINGANEILNLNETADFISQGFIDLRFGDNIFGNGGDDVIYAMSGNDLISGGVGDDMLYGGDGNDTVGGGDDDDFVSGGSGNDILRGAAGDDRLEGGSGDDHLTGGTGADELIGGTGIDTVAYNASTAGVYIDLRNRLASGGDAEGDTLVGIELVTGSGQNDILKGSAVANTLTGLGGNDFIEGGAGADTLDGGSGVDTLSYDSSNAGVTINLISGVASGGHADGDVFAGFENVTGSAFADLLTGIVSDNVMRGGEGGDTIYGNGGADQLFGENDNDTLFGGSGDDVMIGGQGNDLMNGGSGHDVFLFDMTGFGTDTISGWVDGEDQIDLAGSGLTFASFTVTQVGTATHLVAGGDTIILNATLASSVDVADFVV